MVIWFVRGKPVMDIPDPLLNVWTFLSRLPHLFHAKLNEKSIKLTCGQKQREGHVPWTCHCSLGVGC